jgi:hypothetical protein
MKIDKDVSSYYSIEIDLSGANTLTLPVDGPLSEVLNELAAPMTWSAQTWLAVTLPLP